MAISRTKPTDLSEYEAFRHYLTFLSPGTFVAETSGKPVDDWDVEAAAESAGSVEERWGATPYAFQFTTQGRKRGELNSSIIARSPMYWLHARVSTVEDVRRRNDPKDRILLLNMECNGYARVATNLNGYQWTQPLEEDDVVLKEGR